MFDLHDDIFKDSLNPLFLSSIHDHLNLVEKARQEDPVNADLAAFNLLRFTFRRLFRKIYQDKINTLDIKGSVYFLCSVHGDGIGDFFATLKCAALCRQYFPMLDCHVVYKHLQDLPSINPKDYFLAAKNIHAFHEIYPFEILEPVLEGKGKDLEEKIDPLLKPFEGAIRMKVRAEQLYKEMQSALALVHVSLAINTFDNPLLASKSIYFAEAGNFQGIGNCLAHQWYGMGFQPFEEGMFLRNPGNRKIVWQSPDLSEVLWKTLKRPNKSQLSAYLKTNSLHLGYMSRISVQRVIFIYLSVLSERKTAKNIDIVLPGIQEKDLQLINRQWVIRQGISKLIYVDLNENIQQVIVDNNSDGKTVRIIKQFPIPPADFQFLLSLAFPLVGCTGDMSLDECLAMHKIPFYEQRSHKIESWVALKQIAKFLSLEKVDECFSLIAEYAKHAPEDTAEKLDKLFSSAKFNQQWPLFIQFLEQHYHFEDAFRGILARQLHISLNPDLLKFEDQLIKKFAAGELSVSSSS